MSIHYIFISFFETMYSYLHFYWRDLFGLADPSVANLNRNYKLLQEMQMLRVAMTITSEILWFHPIFGELKFNPSKQDLCTYLLCQWTHYPSKQDICPMFGSNTTSPLSTYPKKLQQYQIIIVAQVCSYLSLLSLYKFTIQIHQLICAYWRLQSDLVHSTDDLRINRKSRSIISITEKKRHYWICKHKAGLYSQYMTSKH